MSDELILRRLLELPYELTYICCRKLKDEIFVGSSIGTLMIFSRIKNGERGYESKEYVKAIDEKRQPILKLSISEECKIVVILYENQIVVRDLDDCSIIYCQIRKFKKITSMDCYYDNDKGKLCLCVGDDKMIKFFEWTGDNFTYINVILKPKEFLETPISIQWCGKTGILVFVVKKEFFYVNVYGNDKEEKVCISLKKDIKSKEASLIIYLDDLNLIGCVQGYSIYFISSIEPCSNKIREMKFSEEIVYAFYSIPYIMVVTKNGRLEVRCFQNSVVIQSKVTPTRIFMICFNKPGICLCASNKFIYELDGKKNSIKSIEKHKNDKNFDLAVKLCDVYGITENEKFEIRRAQAFEYFKLKDFKECMKVVKNMNLEVLQLLQMFIRYLPYNDYPYELNERNDNDKTNLKEPLDGQDLKKLLIELIDYLVDLRHKYLNVVLAYENYNGKYTEEEYQLARRYLVIVDTSVVQCYLHLDSIMVKSFLRSRNFCNFECIEDLLKDLEKYDLLYLHYKNANKHDDALTVLQHLYQKDGSDFSEIDIMIEYLKELGHKEIETILKYAKWVFSIDEKKGLEIFIDETNEYDEVKLFDRARINEFLTDYDIRLSIQYLEFIINVWKDDNITFSEYLGSLYRLRIDELRKDYTHLCKDDDKFIVAGEEEGELGELRKKFIKFLNENNLYTPRKMLDSLKSDYFYEEKAVVYRKMKKHKNALCIYISILNLYDEADKYCEMYYDQKDPDDKDVFNLLFEGYIKPFDPSIVGISSDRGLKGTTNINRALHILEKHADKINITKAISMIPDDIDVNKLKNVFSAIIKCKNEQCDDIVFESAVTKSSYTRYREELKKRKKIHFKIEPGTKCFSCNKGIRDSAFVVNEDGGIYDYGCYTKLSYNLD
uniref:CNH domain-containing protein n=1 Tax=Strongyloides stercoralis TaxID=6248 RepID=A0AAF5D5P9_STRER